MGMMTFNKMRRQKLEEAPNEAENKEDEVVQFEAPKDDKKSATKIK